MVFENVNVYYWLEWFEGVGGFDIILPFLLIFAISFSIFQKIKVFGDKKNINTVVSLVIAFFLIMQQGLVKVIQGFLPRVSMIILVVLMFFLVVGIFVSKSEWTGLLTGFAGIFAFFAVLWAIGASLNWNVPFIDLFTEQDIAVLLVVGIFVIVIWLIVREPGGSAGKKILSGIEKLGDELKK